MKIVNKIRKRIKTRQMLEGDIIKEVQITKEEAEQLGNIKSIDNVKLIVVEQLKYTAKTDCFAYIDRNGHKSCYCLDKLYCANRKCNFYKKCDNKNNISAIEKSIKKYSSVKGEI